jgi:hypothetical protein
VPEFALRLPITFARYWAVFSIFIRSKIGASKFIDPTLSIRSKSFSGGGNKISISVFVFAGGSRPMERHIAGAQVPKLLDTYWSAEERH